MMRKMVFSKSMKLNDRGSGVLELGQDFKYYIGKGGVLSTDFYFFLYLIIAITSLYFFKN